MSYSANDLFQLQAQLIDAKVQMAVNSEITRVVDQLSGMRSEMHDVKTSLVAVETKLGMSNETQSLIRAKVIEYAFKTGWVILGSFFASVTALLAVHLHL